MAASEGEEHRTVLVWTLAGLAGQRAGSDLRRLAVDFLLALLRVAELDVCVKAHVAYQIVSIRALLLARPTFTCCDDGVHYGK